MQYKTIRILLALISAVFALVAGLAFVLLTLSMLLVFDNPFTFGWLLVIMLPIGLFAFICAYMVTGIYLGPLAKIALKTKRLADGDLSVRFVDEQTSSASLGIQEFAESLDTVGLRVRSSMAEVAAEGKRQGQFVSDVSHELRTPLTAIRGAAETMMDEDIDYEDRLRFCETIVRESERLTRLANDLLTLQRIEGDGEIVLARVNLHDVAENAIDLLEPLLDARNVKVSLTGEAPDVLGDPDRLQQVATNLIDNASRIVDNGGRVDVVLSGIKGHSVLTVSDDGPGFGDIDPARLFDRFYRGDASRTRSTGGMGLGLTIVKAILSSHDGTVEAFNLPDGGACFIVAIPSLSLAED
ncbi:MAG: HAMP domain-containing histidine kinase [Coriobacteriia bacterium]|jgi:two-component system OmpR family sensor kinase|nr:HAMP domain-containing histidine kinase [Coriobacteriia bacterium]MDR2714672.1 HAMP domain-containing histidine kinase [Coriobacteriales bacterium]